MTGLPGGPHDLTDKTPRLDRAAPSVANTAGSDMQVIVARIHRAFRRFGTGDGSGEIDLPEILPKAPAGLLMRCSVTPSLPTTNARRQSAHIGNARIVVCARSYGTPVTIVSRGPQLAQVVNG